MVATADSEDWLGLITQSCPHWAVDEGLLVATDEGIMRVTVDQGQLVIQRRFLETEPFVQTGCQLLAGPQGLYGVDNQNIQLLQLL